ncbi:galactose-1-phosphate uridylyltransferase [Cohnella sp. CIP 111063]|uniref:UDP-glucose--hexose-1-phosphate uridylyltransferase n=1 Tax=unclassified Cohnella TaxID=2636738 RepID=UPI000B8C6699|nr:MULTISPECIES: UDP-glucose--hexose-1-phosphate uridylyltransferase [unclassified Cohnella]OXS56149.1 galactose-1-phosphate uridylyltransferase [Cohnella sp. CIP 111063]PRX67783.1 UTP-hexose-1-phosphate uridylyltransferase [Cohnella sp. SGD-V74]
MNGSTTTPEPAEERELAGAIQKLTAFALHQGLIDSLDVDDARNRLLDLYGVKEPAEGELPSAEELPDSPVPLLEPLLDAAAAQGLVPDDTLTYRDLFDARIMGLFMPRPSETNRRFRELTAEGGVARATDWFYKLNIDSNYIRMDRIKKNGYWKHRTPDGELEITVNLSKPEKDPREIALLKSLPQSHYPKCLLCKENVGYAGRPDHPARQNLRILPLTLQGEDWFFQYSPYVYYNEHSIVFCGEHIPMKISPATFSRLLDFVEQFPHYFIGSNADLPIVGGSILNHDHFQAGRHVFPMETAPVTEWREYGKHPEVSLGIVQWPMSVLRLRSSNRQAMLDAASAILADWRGYSDPAADIFSFSEKDGARVEHNTITPIARFKDNGAYELDLVLRNNRTSDEHPDGIFHPHKELHHIKKENIGLIEVMGLAVLPGRLQDELSRISDILTGKMPYDEAAIADADHPLNKHADWISTLVDRYGTDGSEQAVSLLLQADVGDIFYSVLQDAGVYKSDEEGRAAFERFLARFVKA